jgi:hypothetical protein
MSKKQSREIGLRILQKLRANKNGNMAEIS